MALKGRAGQGSPWGPMRKSASRVSASGVRGRPLLFVRLSRDASRPQDGHGHHGPRRMLLAIAAQVVHLAVDHRPAVAGLVVAGDFGTADALFHRRGGHRGGRRCRRRCHSAALPDRRDRQPEANRAQIEQLVHHLKSKGSKWMCLSGPPRARSSATAACSMAGGAHRWQVPAGQIGRLGQDGFQVRRPRAGFPGLEVQAGVVAGQFFEFVKAGRAGVVGVQVDQACGGRQPALAQLCDEGRDAGAARQPDGRRHVVLGDEIAEGPGCARPRRC